MKMLLVAKSGIHIEDDQGFFVGFANAKEFLRYAEIDIAATVGKQTITYEPRRGIHTWFDGIDTVDKPIPFAPFENLISKVAQLKARKDNPLFGLTPEEKAEKIKEQKKILKEIEQREKRENMIQALKQALAENSEVLNSIPKLAKRLEAIEKILGIREID